MYSDRAYIKETAKARLRYIDSGSAVGAAFLMGPLGGISVDLNVNVTSLSILFQGNSDWDTGMILAMPTPLLAALLFLLYNFLLGNIIITGGRGWLLRFYRGEQSAIGRMFDSFRYGR